MAYTTYAEIYDLEEIVFIGGEDVLLEFTVQDEAGDPVDVSGANMIYWTLARYGQNVALITRELGLGTQITVNPYYQINVNIPGTQTEDLYGQFSHQIYVEDYTGQVFVPSQGSIIIIKRIKEVT